MPMLDSRIDYEKQYRDHFAALMSEKQKVDFLLMLKERRDRNRDAIAGSILLELCGHWIADKFVSE